MRPWLPSWGSGVVRIAVAFVLSTLFLAALQQTSPVTSWRAAPPVDALPAGASRNSDEAAVVWRGRPKAPVLRADLGVMAHEMFNSLRLVENDVVLCLAASADKVDVLQKIVAAWDGPVVVALFSKDDAMARAALASMGRLLRGGHNAALVHAQAVSGSNGFYPINAMRNFAVSVVPVDLGFSVFILDADMLLSRDAYRELLRVTAGDHHEKRAYVVPCFEFGENSYDLTADVTKIPRTKSELLVTTRANLTRQSKLTYYPRGHSCTEYERFLYGSDTEPWQQSTYHWQYEPFVLVKRSSQFPLFDDKYVFWGGNKQSHIWLMFATGYRFWTVPNVFSVHYPHTSITPRRSGNSTTEIAEKEQLARNRQHWTETRAEIAKRFNIDPDKYDFRIVGLPKPFVASDAS